MYVGERRSLAGGGAVDAVALDCIGECDVPYAVVMTGWLLILGLSCQGRVWGRRGEVRSIDSSQDVEKAFQFWSALRRGVPYGHTYALPHDPVRTCWEAVLNILWTNWYGF